MSTPAGLRRVVLPTDGTPGSVRALPLASRLAAILEVPLVVVSVVRDLRKEGLDRMAELEALLTGLPATVERKLVQAGAPARVIAEESVDGLVCMASSAELFDAEGLRGSVAEFVTAAAQAPVVIVGPHVDESPTIDRIVVGIDPDHDQRALTGWATRIGYHAGWPVEFVHIDVAGEADDELGPKVRRVEADRSRGVAGQLHDLADGALLAVGSHGRVGFDRLVDGSVGGALVEITTQPVLVLGPHALAIA